MCTVPARRDVANTARGHVDTCDCSGVSTDLNLKTREDRIGEEENRGEEI